VVALMLIAVVVLGGAFVWLRAEHDPAPGGPAPMIAVGPVVEEVVEAPGLPQLVEAKGPGIKVDNPREQLLGFWESKGADGRVAIMEFRADGTLHLSDRIPGKDDVKQPPVRWEVRDEKDGIKIKIDTVQGVPNDHNLRFLDNDRLVIDTLDGVVYQRRREAGK
jgi:hypothetical protein